MSLSPTGSSKKRVTKCLPTCRKDEWVNSCKVRIFPYDPKNETITPMGSQPKITFKKNLIAILFFDDIM